YDTSACRLAHVTVLVLLAAAARAGIVAADALGAVADRLDLLGGLLAICDGCGLLALDGVAVGAGGGRGALRRFVNRRANRPDRFLETFFLLHAKDGIGDPILNPFPHGVEFLHALTLVFGLGIDLGVAHQADARTQVVHRVEMVLPRRVEPA